MPKTVEQYRRFLEAVAAYLHYAEEIVHLEVEQRILEFLKEDEDENNT